MAKRKIIPYNPKLKEFARQPEMILPRQKFSLLIKRKADVWI
jgi:hypothetical protein